MLPSLYQVPAALLLVVGGLVACFFGHRLFRLVLGIYGFALGALMASAVMGGTDTGPLVVAAVVGGALGAVIFVTAYFIGIAIVGAGLGALAVKLLWSAIGQDPHPLVVILFAVGGAIGAAIAQRYVIIVGTAVGGAWTALAGGLALGDRESAEARDIWLPYPLQPAPGAELWLMVGWLFLGALGIAMQLRVTGKPKTK